MLNKKNILGIIQDIQDQIEVIESELQRAKDLGLYIPDLTMVARNELSRLYESKKQHEIQAKAWGVLQDRCEVNELEKITKEKLEYMEKFIENGGKVIDLRNDATFLEYFEKENQLIAERNKKLC